MPFSYQSLDLIHVIYSVSDKKTDNILEENFNKRRLPSTMRPGIFFHTESVLGKGTITENITMIICAKLSQDFPPTSHVNQLKNPTTITFPQVQLLF